MCCLLLLLFFAFLLVSAFSSFDTGARSLFRDRKLLQTEAKIHKQKEDKKKQKLIRI